jgi:demethylmenaquinone methyltransferase / 2-methoxy-6-polyprenyl-1,4-benzoquinol methylase
MAHADGSPRSGSSVAVADPRLDPDPRFAPHAVLAPHYQRREEKQAFLRRAFDDAAAHYERIAGWGFLGTGGWYRRRALIAAGLAPGMRVIDVASGTGATARAATSIVGDAALVTCVEPSLGMLRESRRRLAARHVQGRAEAIPLADSAADFLSMGFALRHVDNLAIAFREFRRVLVPGGKLAILDITKPDSPFANRLMKAYFRDVLPGLTRLITGNRDATRLMRYYWETLDGMVAPARVLEALAAAGFVRPERRVELGIFSSYTAIAP